MMENEVRRTKYEATVIPGLIREPGEFALTENFAPGLRVGARNDNAEGASCR